MRRTAIVSEPGVRDAWGAAVLLGEATGRPAHNVGDLCRAEVRHGSEWGRRFTGHLRAGHLVPDDVLAAFVAVMLAESPGGWVLFGYPRTVRQADLLAHHGHAPDILAEVTLDPGLDRWPAAKRADLPAILAEHRQRVAPLQAFYRASGAFRTLRESASVEVLAAALEVVHSATPARGGHSAVGCGFRGVSDGC